MRSRRDGLQDSRATLLLVAALGQGVLAARADEPGPLDGGPNCALRRGYGNHLVRPRSHTNSRAHEEPSVARQHELLGRGVGRRAGAVSFVARPVDAHVFALCVDRTRPPFADTAAAAHVVRASTVRRAVDSFTARVGAAACRGVGTVVVARTTGDAGVLRADAGFAVGSIETLHTARSHAVYVNTARTIFRAVVVGSALDAGGIR